VSYGVASNVCRALDPGTVAWIEDIIVAMARNTGAAGWMADFGCGQIRTDRHASTELYRVLGHHGQQSFPRQGQYGFVVWRGHAMTCVIRPRLVSN
jgi:hypothetical protein